MEYKAHKTVSSYLAKVRKHKKPYTHKVLGKEIIIYPNVMSPKYDWSSRFHIANMSNQNGRSFLEIGSGSGIISLFAHLQGAKQITAVDINKNAILNTQENFKKYGVKNARVFYSDIFQNVRGKFDTITFAAPYHGYKPKDILEYGVSDFNYRTLRLFMKNARKFLDKEGEIHLGFSDTGNVDLLHQLIIENKFFVKKRFAETGGKDWTAYLYILKPINFKTKMQKYIYDDGIKFGIPEFKRFLSKMNVLKVGVGLGYLSYCFSLYAKKITNIDVIKNEDSIVKDMTLYNGKTIPFPKNSFDAVVCIYTLHHAEERDRLLSELIRVAKKRIFIMEETYSGIISKIMLIYRDMKVNFFARQGVHIHPKNYYKKGQLDKIFKEKGLKVLYHSSKPKLLYMKEMWVLEK